MKTSIIPAQITTVEDRIAANLNFKQLVLLAVPLFVVAFTFLVLPPISKFSLYKLVLSMIVSLPASLAIRIKDTILLDVIILQARYFMRPKIYVYKRQLMPKEIEAFTPTLYEKPKTKRSPRFSDIPQSARYKSQKLLTDKGYKVVFSSKSGGLNVKVSTSG